MYAWCSTGRRLCSGRGIFCCTSGNTASVSYTHLYPQTPFPRDRLCMLGWLCIVQSLRVYTPGVRAGAECGATAPSSCWGLRPSIPFLATIEVFRQSDPPFKKQRIRHIFTYSENTRVLLLSLIHICIPTERHLHLSQYSLQYNGKSVE